MSQQQYRWQGRYGPQDAQQPQYAYEYPEQQSVDIGKILVPILSVLALAMFLGSMVLWRSKAIAEDGLARKRHENNELRRQKASLGNEITVKKRRLLLAGSDAFALLDEPGNQPGQSAAHWQGLCEDMERKREAWRETAQRYRQRLTQPEKDFMHSTEGISIPDKYIEEEAAEDGGRQIRFRVISKATVNLTNLVGSIGFYQNGKLVHEEPFLVKALPKQSTVDMVIRVPDRLRGYYEFAGHIKAVGT